MIFLEEHMRPLPHSMLTSEEIASVENLSVDTINGKCESGECPAVKVGKFWRIPRQHYAFWVADRLPGSMREVAVATAAHEMRQRPLADYSPLISTEDSAALLRITVGTFERHCRNQILPVVKSGRRWQLVRDKYQEELRVAFLRWRVQKLSFVGASARTGEVR